MKVVLYSDNRILLVDHNVLTPIVDGNNIAWEGGSITDGAFLVLPDDVDLSEGITDELIAQDLRANYQKPPKIDEVAEMKKQQTDLIFELMLKGVL